MKTERYARTSVLMAGLVLAACSSGAGPAAAPAPEPVVSGAAAPLPGENFVVYYTDGMGLRRRDTRVGSESVLEPRSPMISNGEATFGVGLMTFVQRSTDSTWLRVMLDDAATPITVHDGGPGRYTFAWSGDRRQFAFGFEPTPNTAGSSGVWVVGRDGRTRSVGCRAANAVHGWTSSGDLVVSDAGNVYTVSGRDCATLSTLPKQGKRDFAFAAGGSKLSFVRGGELYLANSDGSGAQKIADARVNARDVSWAPDGSKLAFVINSPRFANRNHVAVHDVASRRIAYNDRETALGVPNESNPCWSPDSRLLQFDRVFDRSDGAQTYQTKQKIVKNGNTETVVYEELLREGRSSRSECQWIDNKHLLAAANSGFVVINVEDGNEYAIGDAESVLMVRVYE